MAAQNYLAAYKRVRVYEGGNVDDPHDNGGRTSRGVTQRVYDGYRMNRSLSRRDVWDADEGEIANIYRRQYWDAVRGDELPAGVDLFVFDGAINSGPKQSIKWLQRALGVKDDGVLGEATLAALTLNNDHDALIVDMANRRLAFLRQLADWPHFGGGWSKRVANVRSAAQALASGSTGPAPALVGNEQGHRRATVESIKQPAVSVEQGAAATTASGVTAGVVDQLQSVSQQLEPFQYSLKVIQYVLLAIALVAAGFMVYAMFRRQQIAKVA